MDAGLAVREHGRRIRLVQQLLRIVLQLLGADEFLQRMRIILSFLTIAIQVSNLALLI